MSELDGQSSSESSSSDESSEDETSTWAAGEGTSQLSAAIDIPQPGNNRASSQMAPASPTESLQRVIGDNSVNAVQTDSTVPCRTFWFDGPVVLTFLRRFGCRMCRYGCQQISMLKPILDAHGIRLVAIGMEEELTSFTEGHFFAGDVFVDKQIDGSHKCYKDLKLKTKGLLSAYGMFDTRMRAALKLAGHVPSDWNYSLTHGTQLGGTFVVDRGGDVLYAHRQEYAGDYVDNAKILQALKLEPTLSTSDPKV